MYRYVFIQLTTLLNLKLREDNKLPRRIQIANRHRKSGDRCVNLEKPEYVLYIIADNTDNTT
jgi:hypothetical protein